MQKYFALIVLGVGVVAVSWLNLDVKHVAAQTSTPTAVFDPQGQIEAADGLSQMGFCGSAVDTQRSQRRQCRLS